MKIVILTTQTLHHTYFLRELAGVYPVEKVIVETQAPKPPFETHHPFEDQRDAYEADQWFNGDTPRLTEYAEATEVPSINDETVGSLLIGIKPDVVLVFGTGKIYPHIIATCPGGMINLHGGDPQYYRGLDTHLWAIYHNDFSGLVTSLHKVNEELDDGDIILQIALDVFPCMELYMLRKLNADACLKLTISALDMFKRYDSFICRKQYKRGRYYSFMPSGLKATCVDKFRKHTGLLK